MNFLKNGLIGVLLGELIALFVMDSSAKAKSSKDTAWEKAKTLFEDLVQLNVKLITNLKDHDYKKDINTTKTRFEKEFAMIEEKSMELKNYFMENWSDEAKSMASKLHENYEKAKNAVSSTIEKWKKSVAEDVKTVKSKVKSVGKAIVKKITK